jgi:hypothetical protein
MNPTLTLAIVFFLFWLCGTLNVAQHGDPATAKALGVVGMTGLGGLAGWHLANKPRRRL